MAFAICGGTDFRASRWPVTRICPRCRKPRCERWRISSASNRSPVRRAPCTGSDIGSGTMIDRCARLLIASSKPTWTSTRASSLTPRRHAAAACFRMVYHPPLGQLAATAVASLPRAGAPVQRRVFDLGLDVAFLVCLAFARCRIVRGSIPTGIGSTTAQADCRGRTASGGRAPTPFCSAGVLHEIISRGRNWRPRQILFDCANLQSSYPGQGRISQSQ
jgi:hypothetical protein